MNKKILSALMAALVMLSAAGCGDGDSSSSKAESTADTSSQAEVSSAAEESEAVSEADPSEEEKTPQKVTKSLSMSVNKSDGKMSISRPEEKSTPMGEKDTWTIFISAAPILRARKRAAELPLPISSRCWLQRQATM